MRGEKQRNRGAVSEHERDGDKDNEKAKQKDGSCRGCMKKSGKKM